jgi:hypothetical protein
LKDNNNDEAQKRKKERRRQESKDSQKKEKTSKNIVIRYTYILIHTHTNTPQLIMLTGYFQRHRPILKN